MLSLTRQVLFCLPNFHSLVTFHTPAMTGFDECHRCASVSSVCAPEIFTQHYVQLLFVKVKRLQVCQTSVLFKPSGAKGAKTNSVCIWKMMVAGLWGQVPFSRNTRQELEQVTRVFYPSLRFAWSGFGQGIWPLAMTLSSTMKWNGPTLARSTASLSDGSNFCFFSVLLFSTFGRVILLTSGSWGFCRKLFLVFNPVGMRPGPLVHLSEDALPTDHLLGLAKVSGTRQATVLTLLSATYLPFSGARNSREGQSVAWLFYECTLPQVLVYLSLLCIVSTRQCTRDFVHIGKCFTPKLYFNTLSPKLKESFWEQRQNVTKLSSLPFELTL